MGGQLDDSGGEKTSGGAEDASPAGPGAGQTPPAPGEGQTAAAGVPPEPRPPLLRRPSQNDVLRLHGLLGHRFCQAAMPKDRQLMVDECVHELQYTVRGAFPEWGIRMFGSVQNGFSTHDSDLDATIVQQGVTQIEAQYAVEVLQQYMLPLLSTAKSGRFEVTGTIAEARIPILKLRYWRTEAEVLDVDLSCHNTETFPNTQLLKAYSQMGDGIIAALGILVKLWAKSAGVSGAPQKHLSSYSVILMVLYYLQVVHNVPCLPTSAFDGSVNVPPEGRQHWMWNGSMTLLLWQFFQFYATDFRWGTEVVAIHIGQRTHNSDMRHQDLRGRWATRLHVEDPILTNRNLNAPLGVEQEEQLKKAIWDAAIALQNGQLPVGLTPVFQERPPASHPPPSTNSAGYGVPRGPGMHMGFHGGNGVPMQQGMPGFPYGGTPGAMRGPPVPPSGLGLAMPRVPKDALTHAQGLRACPGAFPVAPVGGGCEGAQGLVRPAALRGSPLQQPPRAPMPAPGGPGVLAGRPQALDGGAEAYPRGTPRGAAAVAPRPKEPPAAPAAPRPPKAGVDARAAFVAARGRPPSPRVAWGPQEQGTVGRTALGGVVGISGGGPAHVVWKRRPLSGSPLADEPVLGAKHFHGDPVQPEAPAAESVPMPCLSTVSMQI